jgi:RNA polymerase sigma-70 factor, ECF subfamily
MTERAGTSHSLRALILHRSSCRFRGMKMASRAFEAQLVTLLPKMRIWALAMTRNHCAAEDLVQDTAAKALLACNAFAPDTNFIGWVHRIMSNHFISDVRRRRLFTDEVPDQASPPTHVDKIALDELLLAMDCLHPGQKSALCAIAIDEKSYGEVATETGCAVGTLKSRVHRARLQLRAHMNGAAPAV